MQISGIPKIYLYHYNNYKFTPRFCFVTTKIKLLQPHIKQTTLSIFCLSGTAAIFVIYYQFQSLKVRCNDRNSPRCFTILLCYFCELLFPLASFLCEIPVINFVNNPVWNIFLFWALRKVLGWIAPRLDILQVKKGIDGGTVWSLLLWTIFTSK